ncbi:hypothetical protein L7F22_054139 [Adiantum nelumboides]|nr:hypothetical protein [Adiantum nelumboides]
MKSPLNLGVRKLNLIDKLKSQLETVCPQSVSCTGIVALATRYVIALSGGLDIDIPLGHLDGFDASQSAATSALPKATISVSDTIGLFSAMQMNVEESVAMLGKLIIYADRT